MTVSVPVFAEGKIRTLAPEFYKSMHACDKSSDCEQAPKVHSACFHFCKGTECQTSKACPLFNRFYKNFPDCVVNVPCMADSEGIICVSKICSRQEK